MSEIEENTVEELIKTLPEKNTIFSLSKQLGEESGSEIVIKHEQVIPEEKDLRTNHQFKNLKSFMGYVDKYKSKDTTLYYDRENQTCHCVIDEWDSGGGSTIINCEVKTAGLSQSINDIQSIRDGREFVSWLKKNKLNVDNFRDLFFLMSAIKISSSVEKTDISGKKSENSFTIKTEIKGVQKGEPVELPDELSFVYNDYSLSFEDPVQYKVNCDIYYHANKDGELKVEIVANNTEDLRNQQDKCFYDFICKNSPDDVLVTIGTPKYVEIKREGSRY